MKNLYTNKWFVFPKPNPQAKLRLFCLPYSGSGAFGFRNWPENLPAHIEVCAIQLPGRENRLRERPFTRLQPLIEAIMEEIPPYLDKRFALFGHSLGALIAFEMARKLYRYDLIPECVIVSGRGAPQCPTRETPIHALSDDQFIQRLREFNGTPEAVLRNEELMCLLLPVLKADFAINETYIHTEDLLLSCPISAYRGAQDPNTPFDDVVAWREQTSGNFTLRTLPGDHFFIHQAADLFWRMLNYDLSQALPAESYKPVPQPVPNKLILKEMPV